MRIQLYHHRKIIAKALTQLLKKEGYQVFSEQNYGVLRSHIPFRDNTLLLIDLDSLRHSDLDPIQTTILCNLEQKIILLGSLQQLNWYFKLTSNFKGFICKTDHAQDLYECINKLQNHDSFLCCKAAEFLQQEKLEQQEILFGDRFEKPLTKTELKVMEEIGKGKTTNQIAEDWHRSKHTISNHRKSVKHKLNFNKSNLLFRFCLKRLNAIQTLITLEKNKRHIEKLLENSYEQLFTLTKFHH